MNAKLLFVHALSSLHPGAGQGAGVIDLPVAREMATNVPYLPGSSLKGVLRDRYTANNGDNIFGPEAGSITDANARAGAVIFSDQRLLLLPVRSLAGTMAWVTSPFILQRFRRDCLNLGLTPPDDTFPGGLASLARARVVGPRQADGQTLEASELVVTLKDKGGNDVKKVILEDLDLEARVYKSVNNWAEWLKTRLFRQDAEWQELFARRFCIVHDDVFSFLLETATEVIPRNQLDRNNKTSKNLWYEEALPAESILVGLVMAQQVGEDGLTPDSVLTEIAGLTTEPVQLGGHSTIGRGLCRLVMGV
jgi:CRISPR-associated protein Cmr4